MGTETKIRLIEYATTLRNTLMRKINVLDLDLKYSKNPFEIDYLTNYKKLLESEVTILSDKIKKISDF